jgi:hypothetical protein
VNQRALGVLPVTADLGKASFLRLDFRKDAFLKSAGAGGAGGTPTVR